MNAEWFTAVALPVSVAADAAAHVTVFIAPTLRPDHDGAVLGEFDLFRTWGDVVADGLTVTLVDQIGEFPADVDLVQASTRRCGRRPSVRRRRCGPTASPSGKDATGAPSPPRTAPTSPRPCTSPRSLPTR